MTKNTIIIDLFLQLVYIGGQLGQDLEATYNRRHKQNKYSAEYTVRILKEYVKSKNLRLIDLFNQFDKDKSQSVSREELKRGFQSIHVPLSDKQLDNFLHEMDTDGDGEINYSEFTWINDAS
jgi:Ca2+-binding EF-hand superfamily protein